MSVINQSHVLVDWSDLWSDTTWRDCISNLELVVDGKELKKITDVMKDTSELELDLCEPHGIKIKITLENDNEKHAYSKEKVIKPHSYAKVG